MDFSKFYPMLKKDPKSVVSDQPLVDAMNPYLDPDIAESAELLGLQQTPQIPFAPGKQAPDVVSGGQSLASEKAKEIQAPKEFKAEDLAKHLKDDYSPEASLGRAPAAEEQKDPNAIPDYMSLLHGAQENQNSNQFTNNLLKAGQTIGSALAYNKPDYSVADSLNQQAGQDVQNVTQKMKSHKDQIGLNDEKTLRDPTSDVSKAFRQTLAKLGISHTEKTTAWDAKAMGINPQNLLMQDRALEKQMKMLDAKGRKETDSFVTGAQKTLLKPYKEYQKVATAKASLDGYLKGEPSGPKDVAILYDFIKGLDPESAVKEGEIELGKSAMSLMEQYGIKAKKLTNSDVLSPKFRKAIADIMKSKEQQARSNYEEIRQPFLLHGASRGLEEGDYGRFDYLSAAEQKKAGQNAGSPAAPAAGGFPRQVRNGKGQVATVSNEQELAEANQEGFK
jgi:hypothetical protein